MTNDVEPTVSRSLLEQCIARDQHAIETLVRRFETGVFRLALSIVDDPMEASEITQETFLAALKSLPAYQEKSSFKAWLYTIALNLSRSHLRKRKTLARLQSALAGLFQLDVARTALPEDMVIQNENEQAVWQALARLDEKHRIPIILRYYHEMPIAEIAQILNVNEGTIHSRLHNARHQLQTALKQARNKDL